jgi:alpha-galactosidase
VWRRGDQPGITLPVPHLRGQRVTADVLYPRSTGAGATWEPAAGTLSVELPRFPSACLISLRAR